MVTAYERSRARHQLLNKNVTQTRRQFIVAFLIRMLFFFLHIVIFCTSIEYYMTETYIRIYTFGVIFYTYATISAYILLCYKSDRVQKRFDDSINFHEKKTTY